MELNRYVPCKDEEIKIHGRTVFDNPLTLFWTGSGIELNADGSELYIETETDYSEFEQWIRIEINGFSTIKMPLQKGKSKICVFHGMSKETIKNVRLIKEVQPMQRDIHSYLKIHAVESDGRLYPMQDRKYKIEFIGDSITSGEGLGGTKGLNEWLPIIFTTYKNYAVQTAEALNADYRIISQSGWGVYSSWDNNLTHTLPKVYPKICSVLDNEVSRRFGACRDNDFNLWKPDVIVINLGSNDSSAFTSPGWTDPETGIFHKQRLNEDGKYNKEDIKKFRDAVYNFVAMLRNYNPDAYILWSYGMIGRGLLPYIEDAVLSYAYEHKDSRVSVQLLPDIKDEWIGANNHPGIEAHTAAAKTLIERLTEILNR